MYKIAKARKYKYFVATAFGEMPTTHKYEQHACQKDMDLCRKGWPDKDWRIFQIVFEKDDQLGDYLLKKVKIQVDGKYWQDFLLPDFLAEQLLTKYPGKIFRMRA